MPYALRKTTSDASALASVNVPAPTAASGAYSYRFELTLQRTVTGSGNLLFGRTSTTSFIAMDNGSVTINGAGAEFQFSNTGQWDLNDKTKFEFVVSHNGTTGTHKLFIDDVETHSLSITSAQAALFNIENIFQWSATGENNVTVDYFIFEDDNAAASNRHFLNTTGTGDIWDDISGNNVDATLSGFPTGASKWILYGAPSGLEGAASAQATATGALQAVGLEFVLRDIDTGTVKNAVTYARVDVHLASDLSLVKTFTNVTTSAAGLMQLTDALLQTAGVNHFIVGWNSSGTDRFHATAVVAGLS